MSVVRLDAILIELAELWAERAAKQSPFTPNVPLHVFVGEALELAYFIEHYWEPNAGGVVLPGLSQLESGDFNAESAREIRELALAVSHWESKYNATVVVAAEPPVGESKAVLQELVAALSYLFEDQPKAKEAVALRNVKATLEKRTHDGLAFSLESVASFAARHRARLARLPGFELSVLDRAPSLGRELRERSARALLTTESDRLRDTRARVARLLHERVTRARSAIRFAFREHPELVARATSQYRRQRRATQRAAGTTE